MPRGKTNHNTRLLKATKTYSVQEVAELFGLHKNVIRRWFKEGLQRIDDHKPHLVRGDELERFLKERQAGRRSKCQPHEFYCVKCRAPRLAFGNMVDVIQERPKLMRVKAVCIACGTPMNKSQAVAKLPIIEKTFDVQRRAGFDIKHCALPSLEVDMENKDAHP